MSRLTVSTIIPAYRAARTIGRALDSLLAQTRPTDEIVVVDDGSPDDLAAALRPYGSKVTLFRKANGGAASARNLGIARSHGDLIAFLDADDYWEPSKLQRQLEVLERLPEIGLVASRSFAQEPGRERVGPFAHVLPYCGRVLRMTGSKAFELATKVWTSTVVVRRELLGEHRFDEGLGTAEDVDLWVRIVVAHPVYLLPEPLATGVLEPGSLSRSDVADDCLNMLRVVQRNVGLLGRHGLRQREAAVYRDWAAVHLGAGQPHAALRPAWERLVRQPWSPQAWWILLKSGGRAGACSLARRPPRPEFRRAEKDAQLTP